LLKDTTKTIQRIRQDESRNAKNHYIRIGKNGQITNMINPKSQSGPVASNMYPSKPCETIRYATNSEECKEVSIITHTDRMADPPGKKNCHFIDLKSVEVGPHGVHINHSKPFTVEAQWKYLDGMLEDQVDEHTAERIKLAHQRLQKLFEQIKTDSYITYPFKYDIDTGKFMYPDPGGYP
jgi:hypothetical protein